MEQVKQILEQEFVRLRRFAYAITDSKADAEDLVQNAVVKMLKTGIPDHQDPVPWMLTVCKNLWIDEVRARNVRMKAVNDERISPPVSSDSEQHIHARMDTDRVMNALASLPENSRVALSLVSVEGLSYAEAASVTNVPVGTIMSRVARARTGLAKLLDRKV